MINIINNVTTNGTGTTTPTNGTGGNDTGGPIIPPPLTNDTGGGNDTGGVVTPEPLRLSSIWTAQIYQPLIDSKLMHLVVHSLTLIIGTLEMGKRLTCKTLATHTKILEHTLLR